MRTTILLYGIFFVLSAFAQPNDEAAIKSHRITIETDMGYFKAFSPSQIQDFMHKEGLDNYWGGGMFGPPPGSSAPSINDEIPFIAGLMLGYQFNQNYEPGLFINYNDKYTVSGEYLGSYGIDVTCKDFLLGAYFRYHLNIFEFHAGPLLQFVNTQVGDYETMVEDQQTLFGIFGGINLQLPKRQSFADLIVGAKYHCFFSKMNIGPYELEKYLSNDTPVYYMLPEFSVNAGSYMIYTGVRFNIMMNK